MCARRVLRSVDAPEPLARQRACELVRRDYIGVTAALRSAGTRESEAAAHLRRFVEGPLLVQAGVDFPIGEFVRGPRGSGVGGPRLRHRQMVSKTDR